MYVSVTLYENTEKDRQVILDRLEARYDVEHVADGFFGLGEAYRIHVPPTAQE